MIMMKLKEDKVSGVMDTLGVLMIYFLKIVGFNYVLFFEVFIIV